MEVTLILAGLVVGFLILSIYQYSKRKQALEEVDKLGEVLEYTLEDSERALEDHKSAEQQIHILEAKLETLKESTLTPDNSVPKEVYQTKVFELSQNLSTLKSDLEEMTTKFEKVRGKQISERVRLGQVGENFAAFHDQFPYNRKETKALFQPVDLICFEEDEVIFIDVKTGNAKLSSKQRKIRDNIKAGRVRFEIHQLNEDGYKIKQC